MSSGLTTSAEATTTLAWSRVFQARADQVREARTFLRAALDGCPIADDAVLCISELATNSCLHSDSRKPGGTFTVRAEVHHGNYVWIEVEDNGGPWNQHPHRDSHPHGLDIVAALAADSGIDGDPITGWAVWARLDWPPPGPASHGKGTAQARDPAHQGTTTMTSAGQALTGLRDALAALGITTAGLTFTRHTGTLHPCTARPSVTTAACTGGPWGAPHLPDCGSFRIFTGKDGNWCQGKTGSSHPSSGKKLPGWW